jgi:hypothetical protein
MGMTTVCHGVVIVMTRGVTMLFIMPMVMHRGACTAEHGLWPLSSPELRALELGPEVELWSTVQGQFRFSLNTKQAARGYRKKALIVPHFVTTV